MIVKKSLAIIISLVVLLTFMNIKSYGDDGSISSRFVYGARPIGLSNAFAAMDGDIACISYNPAGIATISKNIFNTFYTNPYDFNWYKQYNLGLAIPFNRFVSVFSYGANDISFDYEGIAAFPKLDWLESSIMYSMAYNIDGYSSIGANLAYNKVESNIERGNSKGFSFDAGYLGRLTEDVSIGLSLKNLYNRAKWDGGVNEKEDLEYRVGAKFNVFDRLKLLGDLVGDKGETIRTLNFGSEWIVWESVRVNPNYGTQKFFRNKNMDFYPENLAFVIRGGLEKDMYLDKDMRYSLGMSFGVGSTRIDYAYKYDKNGPNDDGQQHFFSLGLQFGDAKREPINEDDYEDVSVTQQPNQNASAVSSIQTAPARRLRQQRKAEIAVVNFKNNSNNSQYNWLVTGLPDMIINSLKTSEKVNTKNRVEVSEMVSMVTPDVSAINADIASQIGILLNADVILVGSFEVSRMNVIKINYKFFNTDTRRELLNKTVQGQIVELFSLINQMNSDINTVVSNLGAYYVMKN